MPCRASERRTMRPGRSPPRSMPRTRNCKCVMSGMRGRDITPRYLTGRPAATAILAARMRYAEYAPSPCLAGVVDCCWILEGDGTGVPEPIMPDGRIEIVFHYGAPFEQHHPGGPVERQAGSLIVGQMLAPISVGHRG